MPRPKDKNTRVTHGKGTKPQATQVTQVTKPTTCTPEKNSPQNTQKVSPTPGRKRQWLPGNEDEESPCHKHVIVVKTGVEADLSDAVSECDFSLLCRTPSKEAMVFS
jgi:hypothetical protein